MSKNPTKPTSARFSRLAPMLIASFAGSGALGDVPEFVYLGDLPGGSAYSVARGISADGTHVVGDSSSTGSGATDAASGFPAEAFIWDQASGMVGLGALTATPFSSSARDVTPDGQYVAGSSAFSGRFDPEFSPGIAAVRWFRGSPPSLTTLVSIPGTRFVPPGQAVATSISSPGDVVVGSAHRFDTTVFQDWVTQGFRWTADGIWWLNDGVVNPAGQSTAEAISPNAQTIVGWVSPFSGIPPPYTAFRTVGAFLFNLGQVDGLPTYPAAVSADGKRIVGTCSSGGFLWTEGEQPPYVKLNGPGAIGISTNGHVILDGAGGLYIDRAGPFDLRGILVDAGVTDLGPIPAADFRAAAIADNGLAIAGSALVGGVWKAWRVLFHDSDGNGLPDEVEQARCGVFSDNYAIQMAAGSKFFAASRATTGYADMAAYYGRPWKPGKDRVPARDAAEAAEFLRAFLRIGDCPDGGGIDSEPVASRFLTGIVFPAVRELHRYEMLLGNEALADALDPTIGNLESDVALGDVFAFQGVAGVEDLLDEELALLRGLELPGPPADWVDETIYYPEYAGPGGATLRAAVYNRLPFHSESPAYHANYGVADDYQAAARFPQGHGDAYGHYLSALKSGIDLLRDGPAGFPPAYLGLVARTVADQDLGLETVQRLAEAAAARSRSATQVTELLFRRDYRENSEDLRAVELFSDRDGERAWSMADWARRGALGAYLDLAAAAHWAPTEETRKVHRGNLPELTELAAAMSGFQERLDTAGAGLDPLGLLQNVVPFGIDASGLEPGSGRSHFEQVRDAAARALENADKAFDLANQAGQRLRDTDRTLQDFSNRLEDTRADHDQQLIEICGFPSPDDPDNNDLDGTTGDLEESQSHPDLTNFLKTDEALAAEGKRPRQAPGQIQLAISELRVAALRVEQAELARKDLAAQIRGQLERIELLTLVQAQRLSIISQAGQEEVNLTRRLQDLEETEWAAGITMSWIKGVIGLVSQDPQAASGGAFGFFMGLIEKSLLIEMDAENKFDIEIERTRVKTWKEVKLQGLEDILTLDNEKRTLESLLRRSPQLLVDRAVAAQVSVQALGRLRQSVAKARIVLGEKQRLEARIKGDLLEERWKDMSFRLFRNAALKNYRALFDIAARYVVLAGRAYAYEFDSRSDGRDALAGIYRERRLGNPEGLGGGLQGILAHIEGAVTTNNFNKPMETLGERSFSFRHNLLGIGVESPSDDLKFRGWLESNIMDRVEDLVEIRELAQVSVERDYGPAIVIAFSSELDSRNFFGRGPELPFGNSNFSLTRNAKIRSFAIRLDGVDASLGTDPESGTVFVYLLPAGDSVLRENTNQPRIEDELVTPWAVVDQFLPVPPLASTVDLARRSFNPWRSAAQAGGNFLNEIKRQRDVEAQIELGQPELRLNTNLAGRSAWNTRWLLIIPGSQWTSSANPGEIRSKLLQFIYGPRADPRDERGIFDIRLIIRAYSH